MRFERRYRAPGRLPPGINAQRQPGRSCEIMIERDDSMDFGVERFNSRAMSGTASFGTRSAPLYGVQNRQQRAGQFFERAVHTAARSASVSGRAFDLDRTGSPRSLPHESLGNL